MTTRYRELEFRLCHDNSVLTFSNLDPNDNKVLILLADLARIDTMEETSIT